MKFVTRIPTHDNNGEPFTGKTLDGILDQVREKFGGYSLDGPGLGSWTADDGAIYTEQSYMLTIVADVSRKGEARELVQAIGRQLEQLAMYFEAVEGAEIIDID